MTHTQSETLFQDNKNDSFIVKGLKKGASKLIELPFTVVGYALAYTWVGVRYVAPSIYAKCNRQTQMAINTLAVFGLGTSVVCGMNAYLDQKIENETKIAKQNQENLDSEKMAYLLHVKANLAEDIKKINAITCSTDKKVDAIVLSSLRRLCLNKGLKSTEFKENVAVNMVYLRGAAMHLSDKTAFKTKLVNRLNQLQTQFKGSEYKIFNHIGPDAIDVVQAARCAEKSVKIISGNKNVIAMRQFDKQNMG